MNMEILINVIKFLFYFSMVALNIASAAICISKGQYVMFGFSCTCALVWFIFLKNILKGE